MYFFMKYKPINILLLGLGFFLMAGITGTMKRESGIRTSELVKLRTYNTIKRSEPGGFIFEEVKDTLLQNGKDWRTRDEILITY